MSEYLTADVLDAMARWVSSNLGSDDYLPTRRKDVLEVIAQAKLAPDPQALPLSCAMRMARARTEAHEKTWVFAQIPGYANRCFRYAPLADVGRWCWMARLVGEPEWATNGDDMVYEAIEQATCRLVSPEVGERLLRGGDHA